MRRIGIVVVGVCMLGAALPARAALALADLQAEITSAPTEVIVHQKISLSVHVRNAGPMAGSAVIADVSMPSSVTPVTFTSTGGNCGFDQATLHCEFGAMPVGAEASISATVIADQVGPVNLDVSIDSDDIDLFTGNNGDSRTVNVRPIPEATREAATLAAINAFRTSQGQPAFAGDARLASCARSWAQTMASTGTLAHDASVGSCVSGAYWIGQVVGTGGYEAEMVPAWVDSCSHRDVLVYAHSTHIGIAVAYGHDAEWWVVDLADLAASNNTVPTIQNACFDDPAMTDGVKLDAIRYLGKWHTYHDTGGATTRGAVNVGGALDYYMSLKDPNPGQVALAQVVAGQAGRRYRVDAYTKYLSGTAQELHVHFLNSSWSVLSTARAFATRSTTDWVLLSSGILTAPTGTAFVRVIAWGPTTTGSAGTYWWDEIELTRV